MKQYEARDADLWSREGAVFYSKTKTSSKKIFLLETVIRDMGLYFINSF